MLAGALCTGSILSKSDSDPFTVKQIRSEPHSACQCMCLLRESNRLKAHAIKAHEVAVKSFGSPFLCNLAGCLSTEPTASCSTGHNENSIT